MYLAETLQYAFTTPVRLAVCALLSGLLYVMYRWGTEPEEPEEKAIEDTNLLAVLPGHTTLDAYTALVGDRIEEPLVTPDRHPAIETMQSYLDALQKEGVRELDKV